MKKLIEAIKNLFTRKPNTDFFFEVEDARDHYDPTPYCCRIMDR